MHVLSNNVDDNILTKQGIVSCPSIVKFDSANQPPLTDVGLHFFQLYVITLGSLRYRITMLLFSDKTGLPSLKDKAILLTMHHDNLMSHDANMWFTITFKRTKITIIR